MFSDTLCPKYPNYLVNSQVCITLHRFSLKSWSNQQLSLLFRSIFSTPQPSLCSLLYVLFPTFIDILFYWSFKFFHFIYLFVQATTKEVVSSLPLDLSSSTTSPLPSPLPPSHHPWASVLVHPTEWETKPNEPKNDGWSRWDEGWERGGWVRERNGRGGGKLVSGGWKWRRKGRYVSLERLLGYTEMGRGDKDWTSGKMIHISPGT